MGDTFTDRLSRHVLRHKVPTFKEYSFLDRGSDERQYCSPGVDLPVCSIMRTKYGEYPEYHTSLDDLSVISPAGLLGAFRVLRECIEIMEANATYRAVQPCEPQLGKRGLYPTLSTKGTKAIVRTMMDFLAYADGTQDLVRIAERTGVYAGELIPLAARLLEAGVIERC
jgi:aminopeptidase-like protein